MFTILYTVGIRDQYTAIQLSLNVFFFVFFSATFSTPRTRCKLLCSFLNMLLYVI